MFGRSKEPFMDTAVETVVAGIARTNTARPVVGLAAELSNVWQTVSRSLSEENRALLQHASQVRRTLFPVQAAIFDTLARVGQESMQGSRAETNLPATSFEIQEGERILPPLNVNDLVRQQAERDRSHPIDFDDFRQIQMLALRRLSQPEGPRPAGSGWWNNGQEQQTEGTAQQPDTARGYNFMRVVDGNGNEVSRTEVCDNDQECTADSWRTRIPVDDVSGDLGWLEETKKEVDEQYGVAFDTEMPANVFNLKDSLRLAKKACIEEEQRVSHLMTVAVGAKKNIDKTNKVLLTNGVAEEAIDAPAKAVIAALAELAATADNKSAEAVQQLTKNKRALYVLQQAWDVVIGGGASLVPLCSICLTDGVDTVCTPCGHTFCKGCAKVFNRGQALCPACRTAVRSQHRLFFS